MSERKKHRGAAPDDEALFGPHAHETLRVAADEYAWLLSRGYPATATLSLIADRYRLRNRQRQALLLSVYSEAGRDARREKRVALKDCASSSIV